MLNSTEHEFIMLINVKMPTVVGNLTFISMINTTYDSLKARNVFILKHFSCYEHLKLNRAKKVYNLGTWAQDYIASLELRKT